MKINNNKYKQLSLKFDELSFTIACILESTYGKTFLGRFWSCFKFIFQIFAMTVIFSRLMLSPLENYSIFLSCNITLFYFISSVISKSPESLYQRQTLLKKINFSIKKIILIDLLTNFYLFVLNFSVCLIFFSFINLTFPFNFYFLVLPFYYLYILCFLYLTSYSISIIYLYVRDLAYLIEIGNLIFVWITPIYYSIDALPSKIVKGLIYLNPYFILIQPINNLLYGKKLPSLELHVAMLIWLLILYLVYSLTNKYLKKNFIYYL